MTNYKMLVLDLDDTLLKSDRTISESTKEHLLRAQKNGIIIVLASGRPTYGIRKIADELCLSENSGYIISYNGARIVDCKLGKELYACNIKREQLYNLFDMAIESGAYIQTYVGDYIIASKINEYTDIEKQITGMDILAPDNFKKYVSDDVVKAIVLQHPDKLAKIEKAWREKINNTMYMTISKPFFLEFMNKDVDKSKSIERLADMLGISMSQVIAVGDSYNDLSMIKSAGLGVAMGNAVELVKDNADYITADNDHDGIVMVINKFVLSQK